MKKGSILYYLGIILLACGSISFYVLLSYWILIPLIIAGLTLIILSDKKTWIQLLTIVFIPIIAVSLLFILLFGWSGEAI